jgi:hypothetical protein
VLSIIGDRLQVGAVFGWHRCVGPTVALGYVEEEQEVEKVLRRVDLFDGWLLGEKLSCGDHRHRWLGILREECRWIDLITGAFVVWLFLH